jgi:hypothetical protein
VIIKLTDALCDLFWPDTANYCFFGKNDMNLLDVLIHLFSFAAPALFMAVLIPLLARLALRKTTSALPWWAQALALFIVGLLVLVAGLWWLERDGRMLTYAILVLLTATTQWVLSRSWRK